LFLAALLYIWELLARSVLRPTERSRVTAQESGVRGNAPSVPVLLASLLSFTAAWYAISWATVSGRWVAPVGLGLALGSIVPVLRRRSTQVLLVGITAGAAVVSVILATLSLTT
jgi:hypothetical protein